MLTAGTLEPNAALPMLREDLQITTAPVSHSGEKGWVVFDPLRQQYYQINRKALTFLRLWPLGTPQAILDAVEDTDTTMADLEEFIRFVYAYNLALEPAGGDVKSLLFQQLAGGKKSLYRLLTSLLFLRIPLFRPRNFLEKTLPVSHLFFTRGWWIFLGLLFMVDIYFMLRHWDEFVHTFLYFFNFEGFVYYALALCLVKVGHELGHGYAAQRYGCRVKSMGVALLALMPVLYTDTTDSWRIPSRRKRLIIIASGIIVELMVAVIATFLWGFLPDGPWRSAMFFLATTSWVMSLGINMNPLMRYDAYYFLSDALNVQNLQNRSFAFGTWALREILFKLGAPTPEPETPARRMQLILFAWASWVYRFFLFLGIAIFIKMMLGKPFGDIFFCLEVGGFIVLPAVRELLEWRKLLMLSTLSRRAKISLTIMAFLTLAVLVPLPSTVHVPAVLEARNKATIFAGDAGCIESIKVGSGDHVNKNDVLIELSSPEISHRLNLAKHRLNLVQVQLNRMVADATDRRGRMVLKRQESRLIREIKGLEKRLHAMTITAPFSGTVAYLVPDLHIGRWVNRHTGLGTIISEGRVRARGYVPGDEVSRLKKGDKALFIPDILEESSRKGVISDISETNTDVVDILALSSTNGGPVAATRDEGELKPIKAWYPIIVTIADETELPGHEIHGQVQAIGSPESLALRLWRRAATVVMRESML